jgi:anthranilate/para-aminobenzoate synthase component I
MNELAAKARSGTLTAAERVEVESYNRVGHLVAIIQARARQVLERRRSA